MINPQLVWVYLCNNTEGAEAVTTEYEKGNDLRLSADQGEK